MPDCKDCALPHQSVTPEDVRMTAVVCFHLGPRFTAAILWGVLKDRIFRSVLRGLR